MASASWRTPLLLLLVSLLLLGAPRPTRSQDLRAGAEPVLRNEATPATGHAPSAGGGAEDGHGGEVNGTAAPAHGCGEGSEHGHAAPITTLPIVSWRWEHVRAPYLVTLWILVSWICKLSESHTR